MAARKKPSTRSKSRPSTRQKPEDEKPEVEIDFDDALYSSSSATSDDDIRRDTLTLARLKELRSLY